MKRIIPLLWLSAAGIAVAQSQPYSLWYRQPAHFFEETLPLGNGKLGASVFGGVQTDQIYLNDATLWSGEPVQADMNPQAHTYIPAIRAALAAEDYRRADSLNRFVQGAFSQSYAPLGTLHITYPGTDSATDYRRTLDIEEAVAAVAYTAGGAHYTRTYLVSHPDKVMAIRMSSDQTGRLGVIIRFSSQLRYQVQAGTDGLVISGYAPYHAEPNYRGNIPDPVRFDPTRGTRFCTLLSLRETDGQVTLTDSTLELRGATTATLLITTETSFNGFDHNPVTEGKDYMRLARQQLDAAAIHTFQSLRQRHTADYQSFFNRVYLDLGPPEAPDLPTDERLIRYSQGMPDRLLEVLYFQFGRYLLISSSRTPGVPANLQGIWNPYIRPPWSSNYTLNINAEENYWLAETTNLPEMHQPMLDFIGQVAVTGAHTARHFYGSEGWTACHNSDIWAMSNPVGDFGKGDPSWANWNMAGAWLCTHLWEHYLFSQDKIFLRDYAYPLMKGAARFCLDWLVTDAQGRLITSPGTSPENIYISPTGYQGATAYGVTADLAMIRELLMDVLDATQVLDTDTAFRGVVQQALDQLYPYQIGARGHLQEWYHDWEDAEPQHRHQSHLFGLYPGHQIYPPATPALADACRKTLEIKGDETTGWSKGWRINLWARLWDGNRAYKMYRELLRYVPPDGARINYAGGGGTYPNLFDAHPPFQIDGNFGGAAAVAEMLLQSRPDTLFLLPALPDAWAHGTVQGLRARGAYTVSIWWEAGHVVRVQLVSDHGGPVTLIAGNRQRTLRLKAGQRKEIRW